MSTIDVKDASGATVAVEKPLVPGRAAAAASRPVALSSEDFAVIDGLETAIAATNTLLTTQATYLDGLEGFVDGLETLQGAVTETAPASDTASSGLNGRLQRLAQRLSTIITNTGDVADAAWASGSGSHTALLKTIAAAALDTTTPSPVKLAQDEYETIAASQTAQVLGPTGAVGDYLARVIIIPATTSPGLVTILDSATSIPIFVGGATSVVDLKPFSVNIGMKSVSGAWKITTGANVSAIGVGDFT